MTAALAPIPGTAHRSAATWRRALTELLTIGVVLAACLPLLWPLLQSGMPSTHDGFLHVQRLIALDAAARAGAPFSRWLPDLAYGYGQPLLLYYAPLSYVPAVAFSLAGAGYLVSYKLTSGLAVVLSALSMYALARSRVGQVAAGTAAIVYAALPYQMVDLYVRGALAESWAFVWLPLVALGLVCVHERRRAPFWVAVTAIAMAGLVLTHNVTALLALPAFAALIAVLAIRSEDRVRSALLSGLALAAGVGLAAWFWLPALAERDLVQIDQTLEPELFASFFLNGWPPFRLDPIFSYEHPVSDALGYPIFWPQVGLVQVLVSIGGAVALWRLRGSARALGIWAILLVVGGWLLQTRPLAVIYELVPLLLFVQFPWRLLALIGLGSALLAAMLVAGVGTRRVVQLAAATLVVGASLLTALLDLDPEQTPAEERFLSIESITRAELAEWGLGSTHSGEYLPVSSGQRNASRFRKTMLDADGSRTADPIPLTVERVEWQPDTIRTEVTVSGPADERLQFGQFAFEGWNATVDGVTTRLQATGELGLAGVALTPGRHTVELTWSGTGTPARQLGITVSLVTAGLLLVVLASRRLPRVRRTLWGASLVLALALAGGSWASQPTAVRAQLSDASAWQPIDDTLALVDVQRDSSRLLRDRLVLTHLTWFARRTPTTGYRAFVEATAGDGTVHRAPWIYEPLTRLWQRGQLTQTTVAVRLPDSLPSGRLDLRLVFEQPAGLEPIALGSLSLPAFRSAGRHATGRMIDVMPGGIQLTPPEATSWSVPVGQSLDLPLSWRALASAPDIERELLVRAVLGPPSGPAVPVSDVRRPGEWFAPLPFWQAGEEVQQNLRVRVPSTVEAGDYPLRLEVYARDLARGGASETGASSAGVRGRPLTVVELGQVRVSP